MNRQKVALCLLLLALLGSIGYSLTHGPKEERVATLKHQPGVPAQAPRKSAPAAATAPVPIDDGRVQVALLERENPRFSGYRRNIFSPVFHEEVKLPPFKPLPPPPKPVIAPPPASALPQGPPPPPPPPTPEEIAAKEMAKFTFLGFLKKGNEKTVFLSKNSEVFLAKKGSYLGPDYQVADLTDDAITIKSVALSREMVIPLVEHNALRVKR